LGWDTVVGLGESLEVEVAHAGLRQASELTSEGQSFQLRDNHLLVDSRGARGPQQAVATRGLEE
jgi:hypothetical protein